MSHHSNLHLHRRETGAHSGAAADREPTREEHEAANAEHRALAAAEPATEIELAFSLAPALRAYRLAPTMGMGLSVEEDGCAPF